jgi:hypothetical protein
VQVLSPEHLLIMPEAVEGEVIVTIDILDREEPAVAETDH